MTLTGSKYIDTFLSGGLSSHRVHHLLPAQGSGFANLVCEPAVIETCEEFGITWEPYRNFFTGRLPELLRFYFLYPVEEEQDLLENLYKTRTLSPTEILVAHVKDHLSWKYNVRVFKTVTLCFVGQGAL